MQWEQPGPRAVFIDRDGVICRNREDHVKSWEEFSFLPGVLEGLALLARSDLYILIITNQAIINRRMVHAAEVKEIHRRMLDAIQAAGGRVDRVLVCPHRPDEHCACRKPQPGLLLQAARELQLDLSQCYMIGDAETDMQAARRAGCRRYLVLTGRGRRQLLRCWLHGERGFRVVWNLRAAIHAVMHHERGANEAALRPPKGSHGHSNGLEKCINPRFVCLAQACGCSPASRPFSPVVSLRNPKGAAEGKRRAESPRSGHEEQGQDGWETTVTSPGGSP